MNRYSIKVVGESGMGLLSVGEIIMKSLKRMGFYVNSDREYPSLIKGGNSCAQIDFGYKQIRSLQTKVDVLVALDRNNLIKYLPTVKKGGIVIHGYERHHLVKDLEKNANELDLTVVYLPARQIAYSLGGNEIVVNMVLIGVLWKICGFDLKYLEEQVKEQFSSKPKILEIDLKCIKAGFEPEEFEVRPQSKKLPSHEIEEPEWNPPKKLLIDGTAAIALGAIHAGVRTYYAYPMSPSSGILSYIAKTSHDTGIVVKQAEDEITAAQMTIGSMYAGTRALVSTSGGGFDLMTESLSLAGMIENPLVIIIAQRPGPATGLPTWTAQGDLNLAIYGGHGEFPRLVIGCSDPTSSFELIQHALNFAEKFQIPVIVLTEKVVVETKTMVDPFDQFTIPIERGLVTDKQELESLKSSDRYKVSSSGISKRWAPGTSPATFFANGDEHWESGELTEDAELAEKMISKRMAKEEKLIEAIPEPEIYGPESGADISFIGWGGVKNAVLDAIDVLEEEGVKVNYLHYEYLWPFKPEKVSSFVESNNKVCLIENNYHGQLGKIIEDKTGIIFHDSFLKWNGRPFFVDEVIEYIKRQI